MMYVFSDGSLSATGQVDNTVDGRGKGEWTSDNQSTAASFFLVYNPRRARRRCSRPAQAGAARHQQLGYFRATASVETAATPAANNVNLLVETVLLNYMALHGEQGNFAARVPGPRPRQRRRCGTA